MQNSPSILTPPPDVAKVYASYPEGIRKQLLSLRALIFQVAEESPDIGNIEETLKWGEPSYLSKGGSTIRLAWKAKHPKLRAEQFAIYFNCKTSLIETFRVLYHDELRFEGNRALVFDLDDKMPADIIADCFGLALNYHRLKHLPMLGV